MPDTRGLESGGVDQVVEFYKCPSDPIIVPTSEMQQYVNGKLVWTNYLVSYAFNGFLSFPLRYPDKAREGADFSLDVPGTNYVRLQKTTSIRRPTEIVMLTDAGDDDVGFKGSLMWDFDDEIDNFEAAEAPRLEVHHKIGNNFLYADVHVEFKKILRRTGAQEKSGVPAFPWHWVPIEGFARLAP